MTKDKFLSLIDKKLKHHSFENSDNSRYWSNTLTLCLEELRIAYLKTINQNNKKSINQKQQEVLYGNTNKNNGTV